MKLSLDEGRTVMSMYTPHVSLSPGILVVVGEAWWAQSHVAGGTLVHSARTLHMSNLGVMHVTTYTQLNIS